MPLGDLDRDGAPYDLESGLLWTGAVWILRMQPSGALGVAHKLNMLHGGFTGTLEPRDLFGYSLACLPDLDGDGNPE